MITFHINTERRKEWAVVAFSENVRYISRGLELHFVVLLIGVRIEFPSFGIENKLAHEVKWGWKRRRERG